jgi:hypothetical protein
MAAVNSATTLPPLRPANANGLGGGCTTTKDKDGNAVYETDFETITVTSNSVVTIYDKVSGETTQIAGDPHVSINGVQVFDFHETLTIMTNHGSKLTLDTEPWGNSGATVVSRVTITNADAHYGVQVYGASLTDNRDITFSETLQFGAQLDAAAADNVVIFKGKNGYMRVDPKTGKMVPVTQATMNDDEMAMAGGMFDPNATSANNGIWLNGSAPRPNYTPKDNPMSSVSTSSNSSVMGANLLSQLNKGNSSGSPVDISTIFDANHYTSNGYTYQLSNGATVTYSQPQGAGGDVLMKVTEAGGSSVNIEFESTNGVYQASTPYYSNPNIPASTQQWINDNMAGAGGEGMLSILDLIKQTSEIKKKGQGAVAASGADGATGADGVPTPGSDSSWGEDSWFVQLAEALGTILNKIADKLKKLVDDAKLGDNGQPPFKEGMVIQGLSQQLSFIAQALMTALNSLGDAIKSTVTAGGAAR